LLSINYSYGFFIMPKSFSRFLKKLP